MAEEYVDVEYFTFHRCISNTYSDAEDLTEHQLRDCRSPCHWKGIYRFIQTSLGWRKEEEKESEWDWTCSSEARGTEAGVRSPHQTNSLGQRGGISGCWHVKQMIYDGLNGMPITQTVCTTALHTPDRNMGLGEEYQGEGCC